MLHGPRARLLIAAAVVALAGSGILVLRTPSATATYAGRNGDFLLLVRGPDSTDPNEIWLSGPQGQRPHKIWASNDVLVSAEFSPSGKQIAFEGLGGECGMVNANGRGARVLFRPPVSTFMAGMALSPNGRVLACGYQANMGPGLRGEKTRIAFINVKTGKLIRSIRLAGWLDGPVWSSRGELLFVSVEGTLEATLPDGSHEHPIRIELPSAGEFIAARSGTDRPVVASPDGSELAVIGETADQNTPLYLVPASGGKTKRIADFATLAVWSPNGRQIVADMGGGGAEVITLATKHVKTIAPVGAVDDWQAVG